MNCNKCGHPYGGNACFCENCGALLDNNLFVYSRVNYFNSELCSKKSKKLTIVGWVLTVCITVALIISLVLAMLSASPALNEIAQCETVDSVVETMERLSGTPLGITEEDLMLYNADVNELKETIGLIFVITIVVSALMVLVVILLSIFAVYKKSFKCALWAAILSALSIANIFVLMMSIALAVIASIWNKEYKVYCANPSVADINSDYNFS